MSKKILLVVGGGIAAYKSLDLVRLLRKQKYDIKTILTKSGKEFVTPLSLSTLTKNKTFEDLFDVANESEIDHISLSRWADLVVVLPTTANFMSKLAHGRSDDLSTTVLLASNKDVFLVPAMNVRMWLHEATKENLRKLKDFGYRFIGPERGEMACGEYGEGKMSSPRQILKEIIDYFKTRENLKSKNLKALVTAGPTREYIDPVRFISNDSSGLQGYEIALALVRSGIKTTLISGPTNIEYSRDVNVINVNTAVEMLNAVKRKLPVDIAICSAAVSDFKPEKYNKKKIKKNDIGNLLIKTEKNQDILSYISKNNFSRPKIVAGFSAETDDIINNSKRKLKEKNCDLIIANDISKKNFGINSKFNEVTILSQLNKPIKIKRANKKYIAKVIVNNILKKFYSDDKNFN